MYFESFPTVEYTNVLNGDKRIVTNILKRISAREAVKKNLAVFRKYTVKSSDSPESLAYDLYGDTELHWVILLTNDIYDRYHQWPMNVNQFQSYLGNKYSNPDATHHYEINQTSGDTTVTINIGQDNTGHSGATAVTNTEYESKEQDRRRNIKLLKPHLVDQFVTEFRSLLKSTF